MKSNHQAVPRRSLATVNPALSEEWHRTRNLELIPEMVSPSSNKKIWWVCIKGHEWQARVASRHRRKQGCPYCSGRTVTIESSLAAIKPDVAKQWHPTKNGKLTARDVAAGTNKSIWWICERGHEWQARVYSRSDGRRCPFCFGGKVTHETSLSTLRPDIANQWHPIKNGNLTPKNFRHKSNQKIWWICEKAHEWIAAISHRAEGYGCPYCSNQAVAESNNLMQMYPAIAAQWHPTKNKNLTPSKVVSGSSKKVWWLCEKAHEWEAIIGTRTRGSGCPYCSNQRVSPENCLANVAPDLAKEWHPQKNNGLKPQNVMYGSAQRVWWICKRNHEWRASVTQRYLKKTNCPFCNASTSKLEIRLYAELKHIFKDVLRRQKLHGVECDIFMPLLKLAIEVDGYYWHKNKHDQDCLKNSTLKHNGISMLRVREAGLPKIDGHDIVLKKKFDEYEIASSVLKHVLNTYLLEKDLHHRVTEYISNEVLANDKDYFDLLNQLPGPEKGSALADLNPSLASEWHPIKNGTLTPFDVSPGSGLKVWWLCSQNHEWDATIDQRNIRNIAQSCPFCSGFRVAESNNLKSVAPYLAAEWNFKRNGKLLPDHVKKFSNKNVWWVCKYGHEWKANISDRFGKNQKCPYCSGRKATTNRNFACLYPAAATEWHIIKNGSLTADQVSPKSNKKVWWICARGHEWQAIIADRAEGTGCPFCQYKGGRMRRKPYKNEA